MLKILDVRPNGWAVVPWHWSHDVNKLDPSWYDEMRKKYPDDGVWAREFDCDFTSRQGTPCYHEFRSHHLVRGLEVNEYQPLLACLDFNSTPCVWELAQMQNGWACFIDEIRVDSASIAKMVEQLRNRHPAHPAGIIVYGDASGSAADAHGGRSYYDLFKLEMRGYPTQIDFRVPLRNPNQTSRVAAFNRKLQSPSGEPGIKISPACRELIADLQEVVWQQRAAGRHGSAGDLVIAKSSKPEDPYFYRTHASDAAGYFIHREFPVIAELSKMLVAGRPKKKPTKDKDRFLYGVSGL